MYVETLLYEGLLQYLYGFSAEINIYTRPVI
jgi:hypothetical protein